MRRAEMPCEACNTGETPELPREFVVTVDDKGPRH